MEEPAITPTASMAAKSTILPDVEASKLAPVAKGDKHLWGIYIFLCFISVIELYSASSREVTSAGMGVYGTIIRHASMLFAGFGLIYLLQRTHYRKLLLWIPIFAILSVVMMLYTTFWGEYINGARRSFRLVFISIQPSEFVGGYKQRLTIGDVNIYARFEGIGVFSGKRVLGCAVLRHLVLYGCEGLLQFSSRGGASYIQHKGRGAEKQIALSGGYCRGSPDGNPPRDRNFQVQHILQLSVRNNVLKAH